MALALADSILDRLLRSTLGPAGQDAGNRVSLEGLTLLPRADGVLEIGIRKLEAASLRMASGSLVLEVGRLALEKLVAVMTIEDGRPHLSALEAAAGELSGVKVHGPLPLPSRAAGIAGCCLGPLADAEGTIRAEIIDAHLMFDAFVMVPMRQGRIDFNDATVEHLGPNSRMGVSRLGIYVDAPNGRSYLYQFASAPVAGVGYEQRGTLLGRFVTDRGSLHVQRFGEWLLRQPLGGQAHGLTEQARLLFDRTALSGDVQLGDGTLAAPALKAQLAGRAEGRNVVRLHSEAVGRGLTADMAALSVGNASLNLGQTRIDCEQLAGSLTLRLFLEDGQLCFSLDVADMKISRLRLQPQDSYGDGRAPGRTPPARL
jgi:hypothetical protein